MSVPIALAIHDSQKASIGESDVVALLDSDDKLISFLTTCGYEPQCQGFKSLLAHNRSKREGPFL
ncbi:hypothetical protein J1N35_006210 [Gossypium stocksii]|uniref:Uncharacterized protein n=1 Tax=Gossypium stocksii TaxID=47602 RepID=A0A9D4AK02_9ROSI|nr:hypothetical protein J1N35_006210 [Gossypium stocksii]